MKKKIKLALEGGGGKGAALPQALKTIENLNLEIDEIAGVSAGSIIAALYAGGLSSDELIGLINPSSETYFNFNNFKDRGFQVWCTAGVWSLIRLHFGGGVFKGNAIAKFINKQIGEKLGIEEPKFRDLPINLHVLATDIRNKMRIDFCKKLTPDFPVGLAVQASCAIPLVFKRVNVGFAYPKKKFHKSVLVDGGVLGNLPLDVFECDRNDNVFALLLNEGTPDTHIFEIIFPTMFYIYEMAELMWKRSDYQKIEKYANKIIKINVEDHSTLTFAPTQEQYNTLAKNGHDAVMSHSGLLELTKNENDSVD
jgi:NTE family protein